MGSQLKKKVDISTGNILMSCVNYQPESINKVLIRRVREARIRRGWGGAVGRRLPSYLHR